MAGGEEGNWLGLLRVLYLEHAGGAHACKIKNTQAFLNFPPCKTIRDMNNYVVQWLQLRAKAGQNIDDATLRETCLKSLPSAVQQKIRDRRDSTMLRDAVARAQAENALLNDQRLAQQHAQKSEKPFLGSTKHSHTQ